MRTRGYRLIALNLPLPAYEQMVKASHTFNLLDARRAISVTGANATSCAAGALARAVAETYHAAREALGFPLLQTPADAA